MLSDKEFNSLKWMELTDPTRPIGAIITAAEPITNGKADVGMVLYLTHVDGTKLVVDIGGFEPCNAIIAEILP